MIHDSFSSVGVTAAIIRELLFTDAFRYVARSRSLAVYEASSAGSRLGNAARQLAQLPWFAKNVAVKALLTIGLGKVLAKLDRRAPEWPY